VTVTADSPKTNEEQQPEATTSTTVRVRLGAGGAKGSSKKQQKNRGLASIGDAWNTLVSVMTGTRQDDASDCIGGTIPVPNPSFTLNSDPTITFSDAVDVALQVNDDYLENLANQMENGLKAQGAYTASVACSMTTTAFDYIRGSFAADGQDVKINVDWSLESTGAACVSEVAVHAILLQFGPLLMDQIDLSQFLIESFTYACDRDPECPAL